MTPKPKLTYRIWTMESGQGATHDRLFLAKRAAYDLRKSWLAEEPEEPPNVVLRSVFIFCDGLESLGSGESKLIAYVNEAGDWLALTDRARLCDEHDDCFENETLGRTCWEKNSGVSENVSIGDATWVAP